MNKVILALAGVIATCNAFGHGGCDGRNPPQFAPDGYDFCWSGDSVSYNAATNQCCYEKYGNKVFDEDGFFASLVPMKDLCHTTKVNLNDDCRRRKQATGISIAIFVVIVALIVLCSAWCCGCCCFKKCAHKNARKNARKWKKMKNKNHKTSSSDDDKKKKKHKSKDSH